MFISHKYKFAFYGVPRTGSTAMYRALRLADPAGIYTGKHAGNNSIGQTGYYTFACVRNPYSREVSHYLYRKTTRNNTLYGFVKRLSFEQYIAWSTSQTAPPQHCHDNTQSKWLADIRLNSVLKFEELPGAWDTVTRSIGLDIPLGKTNTKLGPAPWKPYYTRKIAEQVYSWAKEDFSSFTYSRDSWR